MCYSDLSSLSGINYKLFAEGSQNSDENLSLSLIEPGLNVRLDILKMLFLRKVDVFLYLTLTIEELEDSVFNVKELVFVSFNDWGINHITCMESTLIDLRSKNIFSLQNNLGGSLLSWFGGGDFSDTSA